MKLTFLAILFLLPVIAMAESAEQDKKGFRLVNVPAREHGYGNFKSQVIDSQDKFDAFIKQVEKQQGWNNRDAFLKALSGAKLDFAKESLVLIRKTEGSGSNKVSLATPELKDDKLVCVINREVAGIGTADIADYCFAVAVDKGKAKEAEVWVSMMGKKVDKAQEVLPIPAK